MFIRPFLQANTFSTTSSKKYLQTLFGCVTKIKLFTVTYF